MCHEKSSNVCQVFFYHNDIIIMNTLDHSYHAGKIYIATGKDLNVSLSMKPDKNKTKLAKMKLLFVVK